MSLPASLIPSPSPSPSKNSSIAPKSDIEKTEIKSFFKQPIFYMIVGIVIVLIIIGLFMFTFGDIKHNRLRIQYKYPHEKILRNIENASSN